MLGVYVSVPFCRTKCSYCNFASDVFSRQACEGYVQRVIEDIRNAPNTASQLGCDLPATVDSLYLGGGTPSVLDGSQLERIFAAVRTQFSLLPDAEITVECAPGSLTPAVIDTLLRCGVNRVSLGIQSFVDQEAASVGRLHKRAIVLEEIARLRAAGLSNINVDLIAGLPHQTTDSWNYSLAEAVATEAPHVSIYMLEVDEDSRLGRELIAGGTRYHAHFVPDDEAVADFYLNACETLPAAGISHYEISNFARPGFESRHNLKYWTRQPYIGLGVDAHSMLFSNSRATLVAKQSAEQHGFVSGHRFSGAASHALSTAPLGAGTGPVPLPNAIRFSTPDSLDGYMNRGAIAVSRVTDQSALEESFFLGLRLNRGVDLEHLAGAFGAERLNDHKPAIQESIAEGLLDQLGSILRLTPRGRLLSNEVFARFIADQKTCAGSHAEIGRA
jgi:putative oxygen-independent coproporphyrinogen III oxidase